MDDNRGLGQFIVLTNMLRWISWLILMFWASYSLMPNITVWLRIVAGLSR